MTLTNIKKLLIFINVHLYIDRFINIIMSNLISNFDYFYCNSHGVIVENMDQHRLEFCDTACMITGEYFVIKSNRKNRKEWLPKAIVEQMGMKLYYPGPKYVNPDQNRLPEGAKIINVL